MHHPQPSWHRRGALALLVAAALAGAGAPGWAQTVTRYAGPCDASAAVALDAQHFVVANDERNQLHVFRRGQPARVATVDLARFLGTAADGESDIEGAARIGSRIYWITSHARDRKGRQQTDRQRFFATELGSGAPPTLAPVGKAYQGLLDDLLAAPTLASFQLDTAAKRAAEAKGGLNIEGLAATPDGRLLIGLRNPHPQGRALLVPLENPDEVIAQGRRARIGEPVLLELGGRGIRSIELVDGSYFIVAGPSGDKGDFALYRWSGHPGQPPTLLSGVVLGDLRPEALFAVPGTTELQLLSDDGGMRVDGVECKDLPSARQTFRSLNIRR